VKAVIGYMSIEEQVDKDFVRARHRALAGRLAAFLRGEGGELLSFDDVRRESRANGGLRLGRREVEVSSIVGSVGRYRQFDRDFMPKKESLRGKWERVDRAFVARSCRRSPCTRSGISTSSRTATTASR
jgi:hypothetical protein